MRSRGVLMWTYNGWDLRMRCVLGCLLKVRLSEWTLYEGLHSLELFYQGVDGDWHAILRLLHQILNPNSVCTETRAFTHHVKHLWVLTQQTLHFNQQQLILSTTFPTAHYSYFRCINNYRSSLFRHGLVAHSWRVFLIADVLWHYSRMFEAFLMCSC